MTIPYTKMQGAGNDFIVIDNRTLKFSREQLSQFAAQVCHRKFSVGADAVMAVDFPTGTADFRMRFYNADGTEAEMCGNGARCIARYAFEKGIARIIYISKAREHAEQFVCFIPNIDEKMASVSNALSF